MSVATTANMMTGKGHIMMHQVRMEILVEAGKKGVNIAGVFGKLMRLANSGSSSVSFHDVDKLPINSCNIPDGPDFTKRFSVNALQTSKIKKVTLGFYMQSTSSFAAIKNTIGLSWLRKYHVFLRIQNLAFSHGTDFYLLGYVIHEHPNFANLKELEHRLALNWFNKDDREKLTRSNKPEIIQALKDLDKEKALVNVEVKIPITIERGSIKVSAEGKPTFVSQVLYVYVPRRWREAALFLSDRAVMEKEERPMMIPFALSKSDPKVFYSQLALHQKFLDTHRNIQIQDVAMTHFNATKEVLNGKEATLSATLLDHPKSPESIGSLQITKSTCP
jgi:hypothetical protein